MVVGLVYDRGRRVDDTVSAQREQTTVQDCSNKSCLLLLTAADSAVSASLSGNPEVQKNERFSSNCRV